MICRTALPLVRPAILLLALAGIPARMALASTVTLVADASTGAVGTAVELPIVVRKSMNLGALEFELRYDPEVLEVREVVAGPMLASAMLSSHVQEPGRLVVALASSESVEGDGLLLKVQATVRPTTKASSPLTWEKVRAWENRIELPEMLVTSEPGSFQVAAARFSPAMIALIALIALGLLLAVGKLLLGRRHPETVP